MSCKTNQIPIFNREKQLKRKVLGDHRAEKSQKKRQFGEEKRNEEKEMKSF